MKHTIIQGDCIEKLKLLKDDSVHLVVTSPPYFNAKEYNKEAENIGNNSSYEHYLSRIDSVVKELKRVVVPGGIIVWNTSPVLEDGRRIMIPYHHNNIFENNGLECRDAIIWLKPDGASAPRSGAWFMNKGKPLSWHPNLIFENVMVYSKPGERVIGEYPTIGSYYPVIPKDLLTDVWRINPETRTTWHDAPFPTELVKRCIILFTNKGDTVLDPFLGSGTTMKVARELGRNSIGVELSPLYIEKSKERIGWNQTSLFGDEIYEVL